MDKLASRLNKAVTRAGGGINNEIAAKALKELGWTYDFADRIKELEAQVARLRAAMDDMVPYLSRADYYYMEPQTLDVLREINGGGNG